MKKSQIWLSTVMWILIGVLVIGLILSFGLPLFRKTREQMVYQQVVNDFQTLKNNLDQLSKEGPGAQRIIDLNIPKGNVIFENDTIVWLGTMDEEIVEPQTRVENNGVIVASDADVTAFENETHIIMENSYISAIFKKPISNEINVSNIIEKIIFKANNAEFVPNYRFYLLNDPSTEFGFGKMELLEKGKYLVSSTIKIALETNVLKYDLYITLNSKADYLRFKVENVQLK
ncbi:MAG: hypothetical protein QXS41_01475 [Candidatus Woesearchaeota archaeon]